MHWDNLKLGHYPFRRNLARISGIRYIANAALAVARSASGW